MPVYHFNIHAYRSWMPDHPKGYVVKGLGILPQDHRAADAYSRLATESEVEFADPHWRTLLWIARDCCGRRCWRLHGTSFESSHVHLLLSWTDETPEGEVFRNVKNLMSRELNLRARQRRQHWFSRFGARRRVLDQTHFDFLLGTYFPKHRGLVWREGEEAPDPPEVF